MTSLHRKCCLQICMQVKLDISNSWLFLRTTIMLSQAQLIALKSTLVLNNTTLTKTESLNSLLHKHLMPTKLTSVRILKISVIRKENWCKCTIMECWTQPVICSKSLLKNTNPRSSRTKTKNLIVILVALAELILMLNKLQLAKLLARSLLQKN